jgi:hypothetical protein
LQAAIPIAFCAQGAVVTRFGRIRNRFAPAY